MASSHLDDDKDPHRRGRPNCPGSSFSTRHIDLSLPPRPSKHSTVFGNSNAPGNARRRPVPPEFRIEGFTFEYEPPSDVYRFMGDFLRRGGRHHLQDDTLHDVVQKNVQFFFQQLKFYAHFRDCGSFLKSLVQDIMWNQANSFELGFGKEMKRNVVEHLILRCVAARVSYLDSHLSSGPFTVPSTASEREKAIIGLVDDFRHYEQRTYTLTPNRRAFIQMTRTTWKSEAELRPQQLLNCLPILELPDMDWVEIERMHPNITPAGLEYLTIRGGGTVQSGRSRSPARGTTPEYRTRSPLSYVGSKQHFEHERGINAPVADHRPRFSPDAPRMSGLVQKDGSTASSSTAPTAAEHAQSSHRAAESPEDWNYGIIARQIRELVATTPRLPVSQVARLLSVNHAAEPPEDWICAIIEKEIRELAAATQIARPLSVNHAAEPPEDWDYAMLAKTIRELAATTFRLPASEDWLCAIIEKEIRELVATTSRLPASQVARPLSVKHAASASVSPHSSSLPPVPSESQPPVRSITIAEQDRVQNGGFENLADIMNDTTNRIAMFSGHPGLSAEQKANLEDLISLLRPLAEDAEEIDKSLTNVAV